MRDRNLQLREAVHRAFGRSGFELFTSVEATISRAVFERAMIANRPSAVALIVADFSAVFNARVLRAREYGGRDLQLREAVRRAFGQSN